MSEQLTTIVVVWDDEQRPHGVDADEWAYTLRMGGLDVETVEIRDDIHSASYLRALLRGCDRGQYARPACALYQEPHLQVVEPTS